MSNSSVALYRLETITGSFSEKITIDLSSLHNFDKIIREKTDVIVLHGSTKFFPDTMKIVYTPDQANTPDEIYIQVYYVDIDMRTYTASIKLTDKVLPPSDEIIILRDNFSGSGFMSSSHKPDIAFNPLCKWLINSNNSALINDTVVFGDSQDKSEEFNNSNKISMMFGYDFEKNIKPTSSESEVKKPIFSSFDSFSKNFIYTDRLGTIKSTYDLKFDSYNSICTLYTILTTSFLFIPEFGISLPFPFVVVIKPNQKMDGFLLDAGIMMEGGDSSRLKTITNKVINIKTKQKFRIVVECNIVSKKFTITVGGETIIIDNGTSLPIMLDYFVTAGLDILFYDKSINDSDVCIDFVEIIGKKIKNIGNIPIPIRVNEPAMTLLHDGNKESDTSNVYYQDFIIVDLYKPIEVFSFTALLSLEKEQPLKSFVESVQLLDAENKKLLHTFTYDKKNDVSRFEYFIENNLLPLKQLDPNKKYLLRVSTTVENINKQFVLLLISKPEIEKSHDFYITEYHHVYKNKDLIAKKRDFSNLSDGLHWFTMADLVFGDYNYYMDETKWIQLIEYTYFDQANHPLNITKSNGHIPTTLIKYVGRGVKIEVNIKKIKINSKTYDVLSDKTLYSLFWGKIDSTIDFNTVDLSSVLFGVVVVLPKETIDGFAGYRIPA